MRKMVTFGRVVLQVAWAKSLTWATTNATEQRIYLLSLHVIKRENNKALTIIIGPVALTIGFV